MIVLVYVDDIMIASNNDEKVMRFKDELQSYFQLRDIGELKYFLGLEIARSSKKYFNLSKENTLELLDETGCLGCKPSPIPMDPTIKLSKILVHYWRIQSSTGNWLASCSIWL